MLGKWAIRESLNKVNRLRRFKTVKSINNNLFILHEYSTYLIFICIITYHLRTLNFVMQKLNITKAIKKIGICLFAYILLFVFDFMFLANVGSMKTSKK